MIFTRFEQAMERVYGLPGPPLALAPDFRGSQAVPLWLNRFFTLQSIRKGLGASVAEPALIPHNAIVYLSTGGACCLRDLCAPNETWMLGPQALLQLCSEIQEPRAS